MNLLSRGWCFLKNRYAPRGTQYTYTSFGEDLIIKSLLKKFGIEAPIYIDIGAHHPIFGSSTYLFYRRGGSGVLVEPNEEMCSLIRQKRPRDLCINAGAGEKDDEVDFYHFKGRSTRSTFSKEQADKWKAESGQIPEITKKKMLSLNSIINALGREPDLVSIDAEGYDIKILSSFDWKMFPKIFCVETDLQGEIKSLLESRGYELEGKTPANSIFVKKT